MARGPPGRSVGRGIMRQTTLSMALEVKPGSVDELTGLVDDLHRSSSPAVQGTAYAPFMADVPTVHFMSISVFPSPDYDPLFVIEANFDGVMGVFWAQLDAVIGDRLRAMIRCCKRPLDDVGPLYDAVAAADSRVGTAAYLEARSLKPSVYHHGNRGLTRGRIVAEGELFRATRRVLATDLVPHDAASPAVHGTLRAALIGDFPWLADPAPRRIGRVEGVLDVVRLLVFVILVVVALSLPGLILAPVMPTDRFLILLSAGLVAVGLPLHRMRGALPGTSTPGPGPLLIVARSIARHALGLAALLLGYLAIVVPPWVAGFSLLAGTPMEGAWRAGVRVVLLGLASSTFSIVGLLVWLRWLERRDTSQDAPPVDEATERQMAQREDWIPQNHMGSIVLLKPGALRSIIVRAGHRGLGLALRVTARDGYLGSMRTVHFAHWAFVDNGGRLMFNSNFDQSWESYLDDFIEKAHVGLTLAWGCGAGFPPTRFLIKDGASHGRRFKAWARHSMAVSRFWYSAYEDYTVDQVERQNRIADGLRRPRLSDKEAEQWINDL